MTIFLNNFLVSLPLFLLVALGFGFARCGLIRPDAGKALSKYAFTVAIPALLFKLMSGLAQMPAPNWSVVLVFFGSCLLVFLAGRAAARRLCRLKPDEQTIFGMAAVFSNNIQLGVPISAALLSQASMPALAVIFSLNAFLMWTFATAAIEFSRTSSPSPGKAILEGAARTLKNPIVIGIIAGLAWSFTGLQMPAPPSRVIELTASAASPVALFAVGVCLTQYKLRSGLAATSLITALKLGLQPVVVFALGIAAGLSMPELQAVCLLGCLPVGVNVCLMAQEFHALEGPAASSLLVTTALAAFTLPLMMGLLGLL